jgi:hypothetical protein
MSVYRYNDPYRTGDAWAYDPQLRRHRRNSPLTLDF